MASVFQRKYTRNGVTRKMKKWTIRFYDREGRRHERPGYRDRRATEALALKLETNAERGDVGLLDPYQEHRQTPLTEHVAAFKEYLQRLGRPSKYVELKIKRIKALTARASRLGDVTEDRMLVALRKLKCGAQTRNHYLQAIKQFCFWAVRKKRLRDDPLSDLRAENTRTDPNRKLRRALTSAEITRVLDSTMWSTRRAMGMKGRDRAMLYLVAATTGLRASELASLRVCDFLLDEASPAIRLKAANEKSKRGVEQPLPAVVVPELAAYLQSKEPTQVVWPGWWTKKAYKMVRRDLKDAGIPFKTEEGVFDFHAWRHTYISLLAMTGLQPKVVQDLARHSDIRLTMTRYAHTQRAERSLAANQFPLQFHPKREAPRVEQRIADNSNGKNSTGNQVLPTGIEPVTYGLGTSTCTCGMTVITGAAAQSPSAVPFIPPELRELLRAWPGLPPKIKKAILALAA